MRTWLLHGVNNRSNVCFETFTFVFNSGKLACLFFVCPNSEAKQCFEIKIELVNKALYSVTQPPACFKKEIALINRTWLIICIPPPVTDCSVLLQRNRKHFTVIASWVMTRVASVHLVRLINETLVKTFVWAATKISFQKGILQIEVKFLLHFHAYFYNSLPNK